MKVSVIVPTFNRAKMLPATLRSIQAQSYRELEIIVVDDGSTDETEEVVRELARNSSVPIRYFRKENGGCSTARNAGIRLATGDCIAFLDSDDQFTPDALRSLMAALLGSGADFVYSPSIEVNSLGEESLALPAAPGEPARFAREHFLTQRARPCCILYRRHVFDALLFDEGARYNEDSDLLQKVAILFKGAYCEVPAGKVFQHGGNKSSNRKEIGFALLRSCGNLLSSYPEFARSLGELAPRRMEELRISLACTLIRGGWFGEARELLESLPRKPLLLTGCIAVRSALPLVLVTFARELPHAVGRRLGKAFGGARP